jgi:hypothetical protein
VQGLLSYAGYYPDRILMLSPLKSNVVELGSPNER